MSDQLFTMMASGHNSLTLELKSEYFAGLSAETKARYECKVTSAGLTKDPYAIDDQYLTEDPDTAPDVQWSDVMLYMISTPSPYTREEIKVRCKYTALANVHVFVHWLGLERNA